MSWKKVEGSESTAWDFNTKPELEGEFVRKEEKVGPNNSNLYYFMVNDEEISVWGNTVLDSRLVGVKDGQKVMIKFLGKAKSPKTGREYKNFEVYLWEEAIPF